MFSSEVIFFLGFTAFIITVLMLDLGVFSKGEQHAIGFKEASIWSAIWVSFAIGFYFVLRNFGDLVHGIKDFDQLLIVQERYAPDLQLVMENFHVSLALYREYIAVEFITGYLLEYSLSADNIFVIILIFTSFQVPDKYFKKVLFWGILGAIVMRFLFIFVGSMLIQQFHFILYIFGLFLIYSGLKIFKEDGEDKPFDPSKHPVVRFASKHFAVFPRFVNDNFFVRNKHKLLITPLFLVLIIIEITDLVFAVDSVPAIFAVTRDPYIVFFSNIFAILGLRSMFFFLTNILYLFHYLKTGLSILLIFIGFKMLAHDWLKSIGFETAYSLYIILSILAISIIASLVFPKKQEKQIS
jgi:tellurite resistance protein TerC